MSIVAKSLTNIRIGADGAYQASIRFKAHYTNPIVSFRSYWIIENPSGKEGYAHGWRGTYRFALCNDENGLPGSAIAYGYSVVDPTYPAYPNNGAFPLIVFDEFNVNSVAQGVVTGQWYHIVMTNVDQDPVDNYASLDVLWDDTVQNQIPDMQVLVATNGFWAQVPNDIPSPIAIFYANGNVQGCSYYEIGPGGTLLSGEEYGFPVSLKL